MVPLSTSALFQPDYELFREFYCGFLDRYVAPYYDEWRKVKIVDRGGVARGRQTGLSRGGGVRGVR